MTTKEVWALWAVQNLAILIALTVAGSLILSQILVHGWALSLLWNWYAVPFAGAPHLSIPMGIGLTSLVAVIVGSRGQSKMDEKGWRVVFIPLIRPLLALLVGWIARAWL